MARRRPPLQYDEHNLPKVTRRCSLDEVADVLHDIRHPSRRKPQAPVNGEERVLVQGETTRHRFIAVPVTPRSGAVRPITCFPMDRIDIDSYCGWRKTVRKPCL